MAIFSVLVKKILWQDKLAAFLIVLGLLFNVAGILLLFWQFSPTQTGLILHYNVFFGIDVFEEDYQKLFQPSILAAAIWGLNFFLGGILYAQVLKDQLVISPEKVAERKKRPQEKDYYLDYLDAKKLASYLLWSAGWLVQLIVGIYIISIIVVNR